ncbi:uncharacterized protein RHO17_007551 isoform 5-T23 [Thomomys bottae]
MGHLATPYVNLLYKLPLPPRVPGSKTPANISSARLSDPLQGSKGLKSVPPQFCLNWLPFCSTHWVQLLASGERRGEQVNEQEAWE